MTDGAPFWKTTPLADMTSEEWESLCDGCGRCCLQKLRDDETDAIHHTDVACRLLDTQTCRCTDYHRRFRKVPDCVSLTPELLADIDWLPPSCAYVLIRDGQDLPAWHPLRSHDPDTVRQSGASAGGRIISERRAGNLEDHIVDWPGEWPSAETTPARWRPPAIRRRRS
ncbi:hypothetical protein AA101099_2935 [Neoasaia chiangmaiensis NBRC 101099]|uniref:UPF0260 protein A0U93_05350 n=1 Tax=Neoasaia chiangmaiensis TaxID=320497 RepID=A0A1U9KNS1_9PROT|nr:YcgN family cysteine cluster protein [Neoasaia chiangmaiensis]AQS87461.1 hypothetical protein A0U93_05350 [Neoasaia chiangmaiensis]GBR42635.1 hypothetical protein AA101099_2935 [Neoasaia chiangmaiensis NBRC 101099]GEN16244.1 UPF0260 protein [Neoasaia chiangmaiensis]